MIPKDEQVPALSRSVAKRLAAQRGADPEVKPSEEQVQAARAYLSVQHHPGVHNWTNYADCEKCVDSLAALFAEQCADVAWGDDGLVFPKEKP